MYIAAMQGAPAAGHHNKNEPRCRLDVCVSTACNEQEMHCSLGMLWDVELWFDPCYHCSAADEACRRLYFAIRDIVLSLITMR